MSAHVVQRKGQPTRALLLAIGMLAVSCGARQQPADIGPRGTLRIDCEPDTAIVEVDEQRLGPASMFKTKGLLLRPGQHRLVLRADGYFTEYILAEIVEDEVNVIEIGLRSVPE